MNQKNFTKLLSLKDVTKILHVHPDTLRNWEKAGLISAVRIGRRKDRRYTQESIASILNT